MAVFQMVMNQKLFEVNEKDKWRQTPMQVGWQENPECRIYFSNGSSGLLRGLLAQVVG